MCHVTCIIQYCCRYYPCLHIIHYSRTRAQPGIVIIQDSQTSLCLRLIIISYQRLGSNKSEMIEVVIRDLSSSLSLLNLSLFLSVSWVHIIIAHYHRDPVLMSQCRVSFRIMRLGGDESLSCIGMTVIIFTLNPPEMGARPGLHLSRHTWNTRMSKEMSDNQIL